MGCEVPTNLYCRHSIIRKQFGNILSYMLPLVESGFMQPNELCGSNDVATPCQPTNGIPYEYGSRNSQSVYRGFHSSIVQCYDFVIGEG